MNKSIHPLGACLVLLAGCSSSLFEDPHMESVAAGAGPRRGEPLDLFAMAAADAPADPPPAVTNTAPETLELSIEKVRAWTIENNLNLKVELIRPEISAATAASVEARKYAVVFSAGASYNKTDNPVRDLDISGSQAESTDIRLGLTMPLETGGTLDVNLNDSEQRTNRSGTDFPAAHAVPLTFSFTQPLLNGAGRREFLHGIRVARYDQQLASAAAKLQLINTIASADQAYWTLYKAAKIRAVRRKQLELTEAQLESARRFVEAGERPPIEVLRAEAGLAGQRSSIIAAENDFRRAQRRMKYILNMPGLAMEGRAELVPTTGADPTHHALDAEKLQRHAVENRMELLQYELNLARNASTIAHLKNANLPNLDLQYYYAVNSLGAHRAEAYEMLGDKNFENHGVSISLSYPIGRKAGKSDLRAARLARRQLELSRDDQVAYIAQAVHEARDNLETAWQQMLASRKSAELDAQLYEAEKRQFSVALRTSTEVLEAQARYANSVANEFIAVADYQIALMELARATGTLLGAAKVE